MNVPSLRIPPAAVITGDTGLADLRRLARSTRPDSADADRLRRAGGQFEAVFIRLLLREMRRTVPACDLFGPAGNQKEIYDEIADAALAENLGRGGTLGIADMLVRQLGEKSAQPPSTEEFIALRHRYFDSKEVSQ